MIEVINKLIGKNNGDSAIGFIWPGQQSWQICFKNNDIKFQSIMTNLIMIKFTIFIKWQQKPLLQSVIVINF